MPATFEPIATTTLSSAASTITFSSIPNTYTDLRLVLTGSFSASTKSTITFNSTTGSSTAYSQTLLNGNGSSASSGRYTSQPEIIAGEFAPTTNSLFMVAWDIFSYAGSTNKTILGEFSGDQNGSGSTSRVVALYRSTSAVTTITLGRSTGNYNAGTTATLYGILRA